MPRRRSLLLWSLAALSLSGLLAVPLLCQLVWPPEPAEPLTPGVEALAVGMDGDLAELAFGRPPDRETLRGGGGGLRHWDFPHGEWVLVVSIGLDEEGRVLGWHTARLPKGG